MFHRSTLWKGYPGWGSGVSPDPSSLIMARGMTTLLWDIFYSELAHSSEACVLLPTFPAGQIGKNEAEEPGSLCDLLTIPCGVVLTEKHAYKVPPNSISHSEHERRLWSAELISVMLSTGTYYFSSLFPWTGAVTSLPFGWFFSNASFSLFLKTLFNKQIWLLSF